MWARGHDLQDTHVSDPDARAEADVPFGLNGVQFGQDASAVRGQSGQDLAVAVPGKDKNTETV